MSVYIYTPGCTPSNFHYAYLFGISLSLLPYWLIDSLAESPSYLFLNPPRTCCTTFVKIIIDKH